MLYSCTLMVAVGIKGLTGVSLTAEMTIVLCLMCGNTAKATDLSWPIFLKTNRLF